MNRPKQTKTMLKKLKMENKLKQKRLEKSSTVDTDSSHTNEINQPSLSIGNKQINISYIPDYLQFY